MRLTRGTNVEVLSRKKVPTGAWHSAVILSGNGHTYSVRYDSYDETTGEVVIERVPRKALRPYPPPVVGADNWVPGNLVEVFHDESWKTATVTEVMGDYNLSVKLLGASEEFRAPRSHLRIKQCFCKGKWVAVGRAQYNISSVEKNAKPTLKRRSPLSSSYIEQYAAAAKKIRVIEKEGSDRQASFPSPASEKRIVAMMLNHQMKVDMRRKDVLFLQMRNLRQRLKGQSYKPIVAF
ncbi:Agenet domain-containing protein [Cephalotus follicularis]|uniref:Agenet domain-containing protein n=1 Tax=Cephalotus follicularis TaxID=3775 RepID=A0A1Q3BDK7_CEPFO|nr:Agenet domain-containing protein [Cephalotus follicularis]